MKGNAMNAIQNIFEGLYNWWFEDTTSKIFDWISQSLSFMATGSSEFWQADLVGTLLKVSVVMSSIAFAVAFIVMLFDAAETAAEEKPVYISSLVTDCVKGLVFLNAAPHLGKFSMLLLFEILQELNWKDSLAETVNGWMDAISSGFGIGYLICIIASIYFFWQSMKNSGLMFLHMMTCALYVPSIVRGDQTAMGGWIRQAASIMLTYFLQYLMFYCGLYILYQGNLITALIPFITMFGVPRLLDKFGYSSGTGGVGNAVTSIIFQGASLIARA